MRQHILKADIPLTFVNNFPSLTFEVSTNTLSPKMDRKNICHSGNKGNVLVPECLTYYIVPVQSTYNVTNQNSIQTRISHFEVLLFSLSSGGKWVVPLLCRRDSRLRMYKVRENTTNRGDFLRLMCICTYDQYSNRFIHCW